MDGSSQRRPWFIVFVREFAVYLVIFVLTACQPRAPTVSLALLGDLMLGRRVDPQPDSLAYLTPDLANADLVLANLESPLAKVQPTAPSNYNLCIPSDRADLLAAWGLDLLSLANNHNLDCSPDGPNETRAVLQTAGIESIGPGMQPVYRDVNGLHLAFLAFDDISSPLDVNSAMEAIHSARVTGALVVVSIHWGAEYQGGASVRQKSLAAQFAQAGAALIWGHHPHVLQPAAWIETSHGKTLVLYSLGNALFDQGGMETNRQSAMVVVNMDKEGIESVRSVPFEIDASDSCVVHPDAETTGEIQERLNLP
jgi:poly-gamma-glutamate capsule biosynthesis protein CapA/YwtB (metallophosphatase superfamily)